MLHGLPAFLSFSIALAHIDRTWVYPGGGDYQGLLVENDVTDMAFDQENEVKAWIADATKVAGKRTEPKKKIGRHCSDPYECGFLSYCQSQETQTEFPVSWLPRIQSNALRTHIDVSGANDLHEIPDDLLSDRQLRVKTHAVGRSFLRCGECCC